MKTDFDVGNGGNIGLESGEHGDQGQHGGHQQGHSAGDGVEAEPETKPGQHHHQGGRRERLDQVVTDLALEPEVRDQTRVVT